MARRSKRGSGGEADRPAITLTMDRPWMPGQADRLGFLPLARQLAAVLSDTSLRSGFVVGIEGPWGSGKSTLVAQARDALKLDLSGSKIVLFNPWLVGERDALVGELFNALLMAVASMTPERTDADANLPELVSAATERLKRYAKHIAFLGRSIRAGSGLLGPKAKVIGEVAGAAGDLADSIGPSDEPSISLPEQKERLDEALQALSRRIIVFVDDVDRLEPREAAEVMRLVRAVGELPNVVYVVCYDRAVLAGNLQSALGLDPGGGEAYLEKVVQATLSVPEPQTTALRGWFFDDALAISGIDPTNPNDRGAHSRLYQVVEREGGRRLDTPRDVIRALNAIKLVWPAIRNHVDFADLVWLQLVKLKSPDLYRWVERYLADFSAIATSARWAESSRERSRELKTLVEADAGGDEDQILRRRIELEDYIPGLTRNFGPGEKGKEWGLFNMQATNVDRLTRERRLGSPHYARYYFSLGQHGGSLDAAQLALVGEAIRKGRRRLSAILRPMCARHLPNGELELAPALDYLDAHLREMSGPERLSVLEAVSDVIEIAIPNERQGLGFGRCFNVSQQLATNALKLMDPAKRASAFLGLMDRGPSLPWVGSLLRDVWDQAENDLGLPAETTAAAGARYAERVEELGTRVLVTPNLSRVLWAWYDIVGEEALRKKLDVLMRDDADFLRVMLALRGYVVSADGTSKPLSKREAGQLVDLKAARARAEELAKHRKKLSAPMRASLDDVLEAFDARDVGD